MILTELCKKLMFNKPMELELLKSQNIFIDPSNGDTGHIVCTYYNSSGIMWYEKEVVLFAIRPNAYNSRGDVISLKRQNKGPSRIYVSSDLKIRAIDPVCTNQFTHDSVISILRDIFEIELIVNNYKEVTDVKFHFNLEGLT